MDVVIISNYWHFPKEKSSSRYHTIATLATEQGLSVEVITSRFYHTKKKQRNEEEVLDGVSYKATLLEEGSYSRNVSPARLSAHSRFAKNVINYLSNREKPDVIYLFVPPAGLAKKVVKYAKQNNIRVVIDVLDLWPEAFAMLMPAPIAKMLLNPMKKSVEFAYDNADEVVAVSSTYVQRAIRNNPRKNIGHSVFIGTDIDYFDKAAEQATVLDGKLRPITMAYIGMLGHSYDLCGVMDAMKLLIEQGSDMVELLIMGDGPLKEKFEDYAKQNNLPVRFTGRLAYTDMVKMLVKCDIGLNVLVGKSDASIINKHADYVSAAIPVINVQKNQEFGELLVAYDAGLMCSPGDTQALATAIRFLAEDEEARKRMGMNSRRLAEDKFDRNKTYQEIINVITGK